MALITRKRGDTYSDVFVIRQSDTKQLADLTGFTFLMTLDLAKYPIDASGVLYQLEGNVNTPASGQVEFSPSDSQANQVGKWYYDIQITDESGIKRTIDSGVYKYKQDITK